jgi:hypothetical protein
MHARVVSARAASLLVLRNVWCGPHVRWRAANHRGSSVGASRSAHCGLKDEFCFGVVPSAAFARRLEEFAC